MNSACFCNFADHAGHQCGTKDGQGCSDQDKPYVFGQRPSAERPYPFTTLQLARLLILRARSPEEALR